MPVNNSLPFTEVAPCPEDVDPAAVLCEVEEIIRRYVILEQEQATAVTLWIAMTWFVSEISIAPLLIINAPEKACAKTLLQTLAAAMSYRPLTAANATSSALFRSVELWNPTIFFDEADTFFRDNKEMQGMVNAGYIRGGFVLRSEAVKDSFVPRKFSVYGAKSIAGIALEKHLPDSTMSRGIVVNLRRKMAHESVKRQRQTDHLETSMIASKLARFAKDYGKKVGEARTELPEDLSDRVQDNWEALLAIAECAGSDWSAKATAAAIKLSCTAEDAVSTGNELLGDIQQIYEQKRVDKISSSDLIEELCAIEDGPWATYNKGRRITPRQLSRQPATYQIQSKTVRLGSHHTPKGYDMAQFTDAFSRYLAPPQQRNDPSETLQVMAPGVAAKGQPTPFDAAAGLEHRHDQINGEVF